MKSQINENNIKKSIILKTNLNDFINILIINKNMSARTILNINGDNRTINPRSGSSVYVDLLTNQSISGIKRFLSNLITNSNVNFNTTANVGRIVFLPNVSSGNILTVYTISETDGKSWVFDDSGNFYYTGTSPNPTKIIFSSNGNILSLGNLECQQITANSTVNTFGDVNFYNVGSKRFIFKPTQSSPSTNPILSIYTVSDVDGKGWFFNANGELYYNGVAPNPKILFEPSGNITASNSLITDLITAITGTATKNSIMMDNQFFNGTNGSIDLRAHYVGFPYLTGTLSLTSKYMGIKPLSTGDFQIEINNITKKIMVSDWATTAIKTDFVWKWMNSSGYSFVEIDGNSGVPFEVHTDFLHLGPAMRFNTGGTLGLYVASLSVYRWTIDINGASVFSAVNSGSGTIQTTGAINGSTMTASTSLTTDLITAITGTATKNSIMMDNQFFNATYGSIDLKAHYVGFPYIDEPLSLTSKYMAIVPESDGNFSMQINNVSGKLIYTDWANKIINTKWIWKWIDSVDVIRCTINNTGAINCFSLGTGALSAISIETGAITGTSLNLGTTTGTNTIIAGTTNSTIFQANATNTYLNRIEMSNEYANPDIGEIDIISQYIGFVHPSNALSSTAKYGFFRTFTGGDFLWGINNISGNVFSTDWGNRKIYSDFTMQTQKSGFTAGYRYNVFTNSGTEIGSISMLSAASIAFNTTSDYRLKQDIIPIQNPLERLLKLKPKNYRFIADAKDESCCECYFDGFLAHEVQDIIPMAVSGVKDDPDNFQQLDYSKLTPICVGAIQEVNEKLDKMQLIIDNQQKMIDLLISRLDNLKKIEE